MFVEHDPNHKGNVAELAIAAEAARLAVDVSKPLVEHTRYDLIFGITGRLLRVQCKWAPLRKDVIVVKLMSSRYTSQGEQVRMPYTADEVDAIAVYCEALDTSYLLPIERVDGMRALNLRVSKARNGQRASINWAADYEFAGAVAQLGRACGWQPQGRGFESHQLHSFNGQSVSVGANPFRQHFGWYMQRAAAGERFLVTRRGKPYVRLIPASDQLALDGAKAAGSALAEAPSR
jgi:prevent-host-death family protein